LRRVAAKTTQRAARIRRERSFTVGITGTLRRYS